VEKIFIRSKKDEESSNNASHGGVWRGTLRAGKKVPTRRKNAE
jgi:hypothetical protein